MNFILKVIKRGGGLGDGGVWDAFVLLNVGAINVTEQLTEQACQCLRCVSFKANKENWSQK